MSFQKKDFPATKIILEKLLLLLHKHKLLVVPLDHILHTFNGITIITVAITDLRFAVYFQFAFMMSARILMSFVIFT